MSERLVSEKRIKCLVWDLDQTLWSGILLEGDAIALRPGVREALVALDRRGILQSVASQNDPQRAIEQLAAWGLADYFLHPQIDLAADKVAQVAAIADLLSFQLAHVAFIDDDPAQRAYVAYALPQVTVLEADQVGELAQMEMFAVERPTEEARRRREFYRAEVQRQEVERSWRGRRLDFLRHCQTVLALRAAAAQDVPRVSELIERTNQLNTAARRFGQADIVGLLDDSDCRLTVARMADRFGDYGTVGVLIARRLGREWLIEVLLVSCRAMGRGVGEALLCHELQQAQTEGQAAIRALYRQTAYNRAMHMLFVTHGFKRGQEEDGVVTYRHDLGTIPDFPAWLEVRVA